MVTIDGRIPQRGDIIKLQLNPIVGSEQAGFRPAMVISPEAYNRISKLIVICLITSKKKGWPFEVQLPQQMQTFGIVLSDQLKTIDSKARQASFIESSPPELIDEVLAKLKTITT
ncbi:MAG: type II toxin-antitoxin system PemK/MazF family toxin [Xenococcaceae cyanobacterium]